MLSYNHGLFLKEALESILINKSPSYDLEVIIIDDGSTDDSILILEKFKLSHQLPILLLKKEHQGVHAISKNFNELISLAKGKYITFLASDDSYTKHRFRNQLNIMEIDKDVALCYGNGINLNSEEKFGSVHPRKEIMLLSSNNPLIVLNYITNNIPSIFIQSILIRADFVKSFESFDPDLIADDWVFNIRVFKEIDSQKLSFRYVNDIVFNRRIHSENTSRNTEVHFERVTQVINRYCNPESNLLEKAVLDAMLQCIIKKELKSIPRYFKSIRFSLKLPLVICYWSYSLLANKLYKIFIS